MFLSTSILEHHKQQLWETLTGPRNSSYIDQHAYALSLLHVQHTEHASQQVVPQGYIKDTHAEATSSMGSSALPIWHCPGCLEASGYQYAFLSQVAGAEEFSPLKTANVKLENSFCRLVLCWSHWKVTNELCLPLQKANNKQHLRLWAFLRHKLNWHI